MQPSTEVAAPKQPLLAMVATLQQLWQMADEAETAEERDAIEAEVARMVGMEIADKTDGVAWYERREEAEIELAEQMIADIQASIKRRRRRIEQVRAMALRAMEQLGTDKLRGNYFTLSIRKGSERVVIDADVRIDAAYCKVVPAQLVPDKDAIKRAIKAGIPVEGARIERGPNSIQIR